MIEAPVAGFTLIELMVVSAIVGILASIAMAQYRKFTMNARMTEAKLGLAGAYVAEQAFAAEKLSYTMCLKDIGVTHDSPQRYYLIGSDVFAGCYTDCGPAGVGLCCVTQWHADGGSSFWEACSNDSMFLPASVKANSALGGPSASGDDSVFVSAPNSYYAMSNLLYMPNIVPNDSVRKDTFVIRARGSIDSSSMNWDTWDIDQNKALIHRSGSH